jgi:hypothetical protein
MWICHITDFFHSKISQSQLVDAKCLKRLRQKIEKN